MLKVTGSDIHLTRGDTAYLYVELNLQNGYEYIPEEGDKLLFVVKRTYDSKEILLQKEIVNLLLSIDPEDTDSFPYGTYWYDIELTTSTSAKYTVVGPARFILREEVTF